MEEDIGQSRTIYGGGQRTEEDNGRRRTVDAFLRPVAVWKYPVGRTGAGPGHCGRRVQTDGLHCTALHCTALHCTLLQLIT
jgi:hypothetical protein